MRPKWVSDLKSVKGERSSDSVIFQHVLKRWTQDLREEEIRIEESKSDLEKNWLSGKPPLIKGNY